MRCKFSPNYFLHGEVTSFDFYTWIYAVEFNENDHANDQEYTKDELEKTISKPFLGIGGNKFYLTPYTIMSVLVYRWENNVKAEIVHVF